MPATKEVDTPVRAGARPASPAEHRRRLPIGAEPIPGGGVHFRVWAPARQRVEVVFEGPAAGSVPLSPEPDGYFSGVVREAGPGTLYRFRLDGLRELGLQAADDEAVWAHAAAHGFTIVTKDDDFRQRSVLRGAPPRVICAARQLPDGRCGGGAPRPAQLGARVHP